MRAGTRIISFDEGRAVAAAIPGARFVPLEGRGHILLDTEPAWQQFVAALDDFSARAPARPGKIDGLLDELTAREQEVLELVAQGLDNDTIAKNSASAKRRCATRFRPFAASSASRAAFRPPSARVRLVSGRRWRSSVLAAHFTCSPRPSAVIGLALLELSRGLSMGGSQGCSLSSPSMTWHVRFWPKADFTGRFRQCPLLTLNRHHD